MLVFGKGKPTYDEGVLDLGQDVYFVHDVVYLLQLDDLCLFQDLTGVELASGLVLGQAHPSERP